MRSLALFALLLAAQSSALKIILNNDDTWASANIREFYKALKASGHDVLLVAPAVQQSGKGGTVSGSQTPEIRKCIELSVLDCLHG
jgi:5'/3'-nucleotidase SurE